MRSGASYDVTLSLRAVDTPLAEGALAIRLGGIDTPLPTVRPEQAWVPVTATIAATADSSRIEIVATSPVGRVAVDDVQVTGPDGEGLIGNPSFEKTTARGLVANTSLILSAAHATLAVGAGAGEVAYSVVDAGGTRAAEGRVTSAGGLTAIPLVDIPQGFYTANVKDPEGKTMSVPLAIMASSSYDITVDERFGAFVHTSLRHSTGYGRHVASLGMGAIRSDIAWVRNEKTRGKYTWDDIYTEAFARVRANDLDLLGIIDYGNPLYGNGMVPDTPGAIAAYGRYAAAVVDHFSPEAIEVFNEFNHPPFNNGACGRSADCYDELVQSVLANVRGDNRPTVVVGGTANYDGSWFQRLARIGGLDDADAISFHPYSANARPESVAALIDDAQRISTGVHSSPLPVWITETGSSSKAGGRTVQQQAQFLVRMEVSQLAAGVHRMFWYELQNSGLDPSEHYDNFGLFRTPRTGVPAWEPKPAAFAQALLVSTLAGRPFTTTLTTDAGVVAHQFGRADRVVVAWSTSGKRSVTIPTTTTVTVTSLDGSAGVVEPVDGTVTLPLTEAPTFIDGITPPEKDVDLPRDDIA